MFIQATNKLFYENPTWLSARWNAYFYVEDIERAFVTIKNHDGVEGRKMVTKAARDVGLKIKIVELWEENKMYCYPPTWAGQSLGNKWLIEILDRTPIPNKYSSYTDWPPPGSLFKVFSLSKLISRLEKDIELRIFEPQLVALYFNSNDFYSLESGQKNKMVKHLKRVLAKVKSNKSTVILRAKPL